MTWRAITEDDVQAAMSEPEDTAYRTSLLVSGQTDPLVQIISQVTLQFRNAIRSCEKNRLHETATWLPEGAIFHAVAVIVFRLLSRLSAGGEEPSKSREMEYKEALRWLELVRSCKEIIEQPDGDGSESGPGAGQMEQITPARRRADREGLRGL